MRALLAALADLRHLHLLVLALLINAQAVNLPRVRIEVPREVHLAARVHQAVEAAVPVLQEAVLVDHDKDKIHV